MAKEKESERQYKFYQGNKAAYIFDPKKNKIAVGAVNGIFTVTSQEDMVLLRSKGYKKVKEEE